MARATLIPLFIALPLAVAFVLPLLARWRTGVCDWLVNITLACLLAMALASYGNTALYHLGGWPAPIGIDLRLDALASLLLATTNLVGLAATLYSVEYMCRSTAKHHYYALFLLLVAGINGVILAGDLFNLYVLLEVAAVASYALVAFGDDHEQLEASFRYTVLGTLSSAVILIGIGVVYALTGTLNMADIAGRVAATGLDAALSFALALFICGFGLKAALAPFHAWLPDAHSAAPAPVSAMLSGVLVKAIGIYALARLVYNIVGVEEPMLALLRWLGLFSMVTGGLLAAGQWDMKRLFAYSSISQVGYIVLGLGLGTPLGVIGALYHLVNHAVFKSLLFLNAGAVEYATGTRDLRRLGGLGQSMPVTGFTSLIASMSMAGIPPLNGFWSKLIIVLACVQSGFVGFAAVAVAVSVVTLAYQLKVQRHVFYGAPPAAAVASSTETPLMAAAMILLAVACVGLTLLVLTGLDNPWLIAAAEQTLLAGVSDL